METRIYRDSHSEEGGGYNPEETIKRLQFQIISLTAQLKEKDREIESLQEWHEDKNREIDHERVSIAVAEAEMEWDDEKQKLLESRSFWELKSRTQSELILKCKEVLKAITDRNGNPSTEAWTMAIYMSETLEQMEKI